MKYINFYISEKLKINKSTLNQSILFPKSKEELQDMIKKEVKEKGNHCSLNHIDVSKITDMKGLFDDSELFYFNGDISNWDVSKVETMREMFECSDFNQNISRWDVSNVDNMMGMFKCSSFNKDISNWKINSKCNVANMFGYSPIDSDFIPYKSGKRVKIK